MNDFYKITQEDKDSFDLLANDIDKERTHTDGWKHDLYSLVRHQMTYIIKLEKRVSDFEKRMHSQESWDMPLGEII